MSQITYLTRRYGGVFYVQFRITTFSGAKRLLRFSLGTKDKIVAQRRLISYLSWLLPMQTALRPGQLFQDILAQGRAMILTGPALSPAEIDFRMRFTETGWTHREDWIASNPCPIRDHEAYACQDEVRCTLVMLREMAAEDMRRIDKSEVNPDFLRQSEPIRSLCFDQNTGKVRAYQPDEFRAIYEDDADRDFGLRPGETSIYDLYYTETGQRKKFAAGQSQQPVSRPEPAYSAGEGIKPGGLEAVPNEAACGEAFAAKSACGEAICRRDILGERDLVSSEPVPSDPRPKMETVTEDAYCEADLKRTISGGSEIDFAAHALSISESDLAGQAKPTANGAPPRGLTSELLGLFLADARARKDNDNASRDVRPYVEFLIAILGDRANAAYNRDEIKKLNLAFTSIPHPKGMPVASRVSLISRYRYAEVHGWEGLERLSETTISNRIVSGLNRFFDWITAEKHYTGDRPKFELVGEKNYVALNRDAFTDDEVKRLFGLPKFTGHLAKNTQTPGPFLNQDHLYWAYLLMYLGGLRPAEAAQLEIGDIKVAEGIFFFDLQPFDPEKGRVLRSEVRKFKTGNASRFVPIHPLIVELGLLERAQKLKDRGHSRLFPDCKPKILKGGDLKWGHALARDWQRRKQDVKIRANISAYSGRHSMTALLDELGVPLRDRERMLGHAHSGVSGTYGRKSAMRPVIAELFTKADLPIIRWLKETLVAARDRVDDEDRLFEPWLKLPVSK